MINEITDLNFIHILKENLEQRVKEVITEKIVEEQLNEYEIKLRDTIKPLVESVSFNGIEGVRNMLMMREELHVYLHIND